jgi:RNA polymerase sigma factor (sigma-70 family)
LARKAGSLVERSVLTGWLYTSTRYAAAQIRRAEYRRQRREQEIYDMNQLLADSEPPIEWLRLRPVIDDALHSLAEKDREAILLRFFEGHSFATVGAQLSLNDDAARMRVERALKKLRLDLARKGVTSSAGALMAALATQAGATAPSGLAVGISATALANAASGSAGAALATFLMINKIPLALTSAFAVAALSGFAVQNQTNDKLSQQLDSLRSTPAMIEALQSENARLANLANEITLLRRDDAELSAAERQVAALKARFERAALNGSERASSSGLNKAGAVADVKNLDRAPKSNGQIPPKYPPDLQSAGIGAEVRVQFIVDTQGTVQNESVVHTSLLADELISEPSQTAVVNGISADQAQHAFEAAALEAVRQWKFDAGMKGGRLVNTRMAVPVTFSSHAEGAIVATPMVQTEKSLTSDWF